MSLEFINPYTVLATSAVASWQLRQASTNKGATGLYQQMKRWWLYRRTLNELASLSDRELSDIGLVRADIATAAAHACDRD